MAATVKKKTREEKRAENKANWPSQPDNVYSKFVRVKDVLRERKPDQVDINTLSIDALREIMRDSNEEISKRLEAAEIVLGYELPPAALAHALIEPVTSEAFIFLKWVSNIPEIPSAVRLRVLKSLASIESAKPRKVDPAAADQRRRREVSMANAVRRIELRRLGMWKALDGGWFIGFSDTVDIPAITDGRARTREELLSIRIKNRPDPWDELMSTQHVVSDRH